jgi:hypothetical protein
MTNSLSSVCQRRELGCAGRLYDSCPSAGLSPVAVTPADSVAGIDQHRVRSRAGERD